MGRDFRRVAADFGLAEVPGGLVVFDQVLYDAAIARIGVKAITAEINKRQEALAFIDGPDKYDDVKAMKEAIDQTT